MVDDLEYEQQVDAFKRRIQSFSPNDFRALTRRIKPDSLDIVARTLLQTCSPSAAEEEVIAALGTVALPRETHFYSLREKEVLLWEEWSQLTKGTGRNG